jgi:flagellar hook-basal body complex protein FliE
MALLTEINALVSQQRQTELQQSVSRLGQHQMLHQLRSSSVEFSGSPSSDFETRSYHAAMGTPQVQRAPGFSEMLEGLVKGVDAKQKHAGREVEDLLSGRSDNIHEATIAMRESGVAFNLMLEIRNKLQESYQTLRRMNV